MRFFLFLLKQILFNFLTIYLCNTNCSLTPISQPLEHPRTERRGETQGRAHREIHRQDPDLAEPPPRRPGHPPASALRHAPAAPCHAHAPPAPHDAGLPLPYAPRPPPAPHDAAAAHGAAGATHGPTRHGSGDGSADAPTRWLARAAGVSREDHVEYYEYHVQFLMVLARRKR